MLFLAFFLQVDVHVPNEVMPVTVDLHLRKIEKGDRFIVETEKERFTYLVKKIRIVDKDDRTVIVPKPKATLTVITCYPFGYAGKAPKRFVVMAELINGS